MREENRLRGFDLSLNHCPANFGKSDPAELHNPTALPAVKTTATLFRGGDRNSSRVRRNTVRETHIPATF
jgi:hypothetical protein